MKSQLFEKVKLLAKVSDDNKLWLDMLVDKLLIDVKAYLNRDVPIELESTMALKLVAYINDSGIFLTDEERQDKAPVSSISEGDTSVSYAVSAQPADMIGDADFLDKDFKRTLQHYRRLPWSGN